MGMISPFISAYAVKLGASSSEMGWFQSSANLSNNVMQVFWGRLSDRKGRRVPFLVLGNLIIAILWIPMMFVTNASQLIILVAVQALLGSMATPTWTALIGDLVPSFKLGRTSASISLWASVGSLAATLISGLIMVSVGGSLQEMFFIPFIGAIICGLISAFIMLQVKENKNKSSSNEKHLFLDVFEIFVNARKSQDFMRYSVVKGIFTFFMSISWPLFSITLIEVLQASMLEIALLSVVQSTVTIVFQRRIGS